MVVIAVITVLFCGFLLTVCSVQVKRIDNLRAKLACEKQFCDTERERGNAWKERAYSAESPIKKMVELAKGVTQ